jgi:Flp pilus assembly protein TadD
LGQLDKAQSVLDRVVSLAPDVAVFNYHLGALYAELKNSSKAEKYLKIAKELADKQGDKVISEKVIELLVRTE